MVEVSNRAKSRNNEYGITVLISRQKMKGSRALTIRGMSIDQVYQHIKFYFKTLENQNATIKIKSEDE